MRKVFHLNEQTPPLPKVNYGKYNVREILNNGWRSAAIVGVALLVIGWVIVQSRPMTMPAQGVQPKAQDEATEPAATAGLNPKYASLLDVGGDYYVDPDTKDLLHLDGDGIMQHTAYSCANIADFDLWVTNKIADVKSRCVDLEAEARRSAATQDRADCGYSFKKAVALYDQGVTGGYDWCADKPVTP